MPPEQDTQDNQEQTPPSTEKPEWLDPKFATPEDQAKAYSAAERRMREVEAEQQKLSQQNQQLWGLVQEQYDFDAQGNPVPKRGQPTAVTPPASETPSSDDFFADPAGAVMRILDERDKRMQENIQKAIQAGLQPIMPIVSQSAQQSVFSEFAGMPEEALNRAREVIKKLPADQQFNPEIQKILIKAEIGDYAIQQLRGKGNGAGGGAPVTTGGTRTTILGELSSGRGTITGDGGAKGESPDEKHVRAAMFGMSPEEWKKQQEAAERDNMIGKDEF